MSSKTEPGKHFNSNSAGGHARQQNGDQIYDKIESLHQGDNFYTAPTQPVAVPRSGYLSPQRWIDGPKNDAAILNAAGHGQIPRLKYLLKQPDKDHNHMDQNGWGALHHATSKGCVEAVRVLLQEGFDPGLQNSSQDGLTPLALAVTNQNTEIAEMLLEAGAPVNATWNVPGNLKFYSALAEAILLPSESLVTILHKHGADMNMKFPIRDTEAWLDPFALSVLTGSTSIVELVVKYGACVTSRISIAFADAIGVYINSRGRQSFKPFPGSVDGPIWNVSPLAFAVVSQPATDLLRLLLSWTPLSEFCNETFHLAALIEHVAAMDLLTQSGVNVNCAFRGRTALHLAAYFNRTRSVELLLDMGANIDLPDVLLRTKVVITVAHKRPHVHFRGFEHEYVQIAVGKKLLTARIPLIELDRIIPKSMGCPPLFYAIHSPETLEYLLERKADFTSAAHFTGYTALHHAAEFLEPDSARVLMRHGASRATLCKAGQTPFDVALNVLADDNASRRRKRELLEMLRIVPIEDFAKVVRLGATRSRNLAPAGNHVYRDRASDSSWALSERYSNTSWAFSERYSRASLASSKRHSIRSQVFNLEEGHEDTKDAQRDAK